MAFDIGGGEDREESKEVDKEGVEPALCLSPILDNKEGVYCSVFLGGESVVVFGVKDKEFIIGVCVKTVLLCAKGEVGGVEHVLTLVLILMLLFELLFELLTELLIELLLFEFGVPLGGKVE